MRVGLRLWYWVPTVRPPQVRAAVRRHCVEERIAGAGLTGWSRRRQELSGQKAASPPIGLPRFDPCCTNARAGNRKLRIISASLMAILLKTRHMLAQPRLLIAAIAFFTHPKVG